MEAQRYLQRTINRITVVLPGESKEMLETLRYAAGLSKLCDASVLLMYVMEPPPLVPYLTTGPLIQVVIPARAWEGVQSGAESTLRSAERMLAAMGVKAETKLITAVGGIGRSVGNAARGECDLMVVPQDPVRGIQRLFRRSVAVDLVKNATCPVVVVGAR